MGKGTTEQIAQFIIDTPSQNIPEAAILQAKRMFINIIAIQLSASVVGDAGKITIDYIKSLGGVPESTVVGGGFRTSCTNAAFVNGFLGHALDFDDWEMEARPWHPSAMLVSTALALGEKFDLPGKALLDAYVIGLEVYARIMRGSADIGARGWCGTAITGTMGAAGTAARLLNLTIPQTRMTLGIAASGASGILRQAGTMTKPFHLGNASRNAIEAALLAQSGFTSDDSIIEAPKGYSDCFAGPGTCDYKKMTEDIGHPFHLLSPGLGIKPYPCCIQEYRSIEGLIELMEKNHFKYEDVDQVKVAISPMHYQRLNYLEPVSGLQSKFSVSYALAVTLFWGKPKAEYFTDEAVQSSQMKEVLSMIKVVVDETIPEDWSNTWNLLTIRLKNGQTLTNKRSGVPKGDIRNALTLDELLTKYRENTSLILDRSNMDRSIELLLDLDKLDHLSELMDILKTNRPLMSKRGE